CETRPNNPRVKAVCARHAPPAPGPAPTAEAVRDGLLSLADLVAHRAAPDVGADIDRFQEDFRSTRAAADVLEKYKELPECWHTLQFKYFREVARPAETFRASPDDAAALEDYGMDLRQEAQRARAHAQGLPAGQAEAGWLDALDQVAAGLLQGIRAGDEAVGRRGRRRPNQPIARE